MKQARAVLVIGLALLAALWPRVCPASAAEAGEIPNVLIVQQRKAYARIVIPSGATKPAQGFAALLADYVQKSTSARLDVVREPAPADELVAIHLGATSYATGLNLGVEKLDSDGFVIAFPDARHIVLLGASDSGQDNAVYEFLERYVGVRWLFPGKVGENIPARESLAIPAAEVREQPMFRQRLLSGVVFRINSASSVHVVSR